MKDDSIDQLLNDVQQAEEDSEIESTEVPETIRSSKPVTVPPTPPTEEDDLASFMSSTVAAIEADAKKTDVERILEAADEPPPVLEDDDPQATANAMGIEAHKDVPEIKKAWMLNHDFVLVKSITQLNSIIDQAIEHGKCALDLETEGLDSRIYKNKETGKWETVHKIVGICLSIDGKTGYYAPIRHTAPNAKNLPVALVEAALTRLCRAALPILTEEGMAEHPLSSKKIAEKGKVVLYFWHAKFDQEFLYPVTGIDYWHPESFEDTMLMLYCKYSNDKNLGLKEKAKVNLTTKVPIELSASDPLRLQKDLVLTLEGDVHKVQFKGGPLSGKLQDVPYEMIELKHLFAKGRPIKFAELEPEEGLLYGCSDGICTMLIPEHQNIKPLFKDNKYAFTYRLEKQVAQVVRVMERYRVPIDKAYVHALYAEATIEKTKYEEEILAFAREKPGFESLDLNSAKQLGDFLFEPRGLDISPKPERNEASGQYKTDADTLESLVNDHPNPHPVLQKVVKYRQVDKVIGTYMDNMIAACNEYDEVRVQFKQTGTPTGRFSAPGGKIDQGYSGFPIHGIPATYDKKKPAVALGLRRAFRARPGYTMVKIDYAGEELRIATNVSKEPVWLKEFKEGTGDLHTITARAFFGKQEVSKQERQQGKCVHPDTLVCANGTYVEISSLGKFPDLPDTFAEHHGTIFSVSGEAPFTALYNGGFKPLVHVVSSTGVITCTREHRFLMEGGSWVRAGDLKPGNLFNSVELPRYEGKKSWFDLRNSVETSDFLAAGRIATLMRAAGHCIQVSLRDSSTVLIQRVLSAVPNEVLAVLDAGEGPCVDITMAAEPHSYLANGYTSHNTANFALIYGGGAQAVVRATGCSPQEGARRKANFDKSVPIFAKWVNKQKLFVREHKGVYSAFKRWMSIPDIDNPEKKIQAACERYATNWPIQSSGGDIMKIALVLLHQEFYRRGWGWDQADIVRMLLTVHDEIVFEVKNEYMESVIPVVKENMESPSRMVGWEIPLVAEVLLDETWDAKYDWEMIKHGKPYKEGAKLDAIEVQIGDRVYHRVPAWLENFVTPDWKKDGSTLPPVPMPPAAPPPGGGQGSLVTATSSEPVAIPRALQNGTQGQTNGAMSRLEKILTIRISLPNYTRATVDSVCGAAAASFPDDPDTGYLLALKDSFGNILIDPDRCPVLIDKDKIAEALIRMGFTKPSLAS